MQRAVQDQPTVTGSCLCGAVRFRGVLPPKWVAHCHCSMCRRAQGAGFVTWVGTDEKRFVVESGAEVLRRYQSSAEGSRSFCGRCGSPLFFESARWPGELHITLASIDPAVAATLQPQGHVHWSQRVPWIGDIHDGLSRHAESGGASS